MIRSAVPADLPVLESIERRCFTAARRSSHRALQYSLNSSFQQVFLAISRAAGVRGVAGAMTLYNYPRSIRIYSVAVLPEFRNAGAGRKLVNRAILLARRSGRNFVSLEADRRNRRLIAWYESFGFETVRVLKDYYSPGRDAVRMRLCLKTAERERVCGGS